MKGAFCIAHIQIVRSLKECSVLALDVSAVSLYTLGCNMERGLLDGDHLKSLLFDIPISGLPIQMVSVEFPSGQGDRPHFCREREHSNCLSNNFDFERFDEYD